MGSPASGKGGGKVYPKAQIGGSGCRGIRREPWCLNSFRNQVRKKRYRTAEVTWCDVVSKPLWKSERVGVMKAVAEMRMAVF